MRWSTRSRQSGGSVVLKAPAAKVEVGERARHRRHRRRQALSGRCGDLDRADAAASAAWCPDLPAADVARYAAIRNIGVVCVVFRLKRSITPHFWVNITDPRFEIPGIVEFSNLRPTGDTVVYIPYYMPVTHPKFAKDDAYFRDEGFGYLKLINPQLRDDDLIACHVGRLRHAQPVCPPGFLADAAAGRDRDRRPADRRHLLLLSRGPRHFRKRALRQS